MKIIECLLAWSILSLTACTPQSQTHITSIDAVEAEIAITPTPTRYMPCYQAAKTQFDLNECAMEEKDAAMGELERLLATLQLPPSDKQTLQQFQIDWNAYTERECRFFYGKVITSTTGTLSYERGSWAPMLFNDCIASRTWQRIQEIESAYSQGQPYQNQKELEK